MSNVRLPAVPSAIAAAMAKPVPRPPATVAPTILNQTESSESGFIDFSTTTSYPVNVPVSVYTTKKRWAGIDVYVNIQNVAPIIVRVWVYALTGARRTLVATGWTFSSSSAAVKAVTSRTASARTIAERFEVVVQLCQMGVGTPPVSVSFVASDECLDVDDEDNAVSLLTGSIGTSPSVLPAFTPPANFGDMQTRLTGAIVTNTTAAVLYWQALDSPSVVLANGQQPIVSVAVPAHETVLVPTALLSGYRFGVQGCVCGGSSTAAVFTAAAAGEILQQVWGC